MPEFLAEVVIERISFDFGVEFLANDGSVVRVEGEGSVAGHGVSQLTFDAESASPVAAALLGFLHRKAVLSIDENTLELSVPDMGLALRVGPSAEYEAWSAVLADGSRLVCADGGKVARWPAP